MARFFKAPITIAQAPVVRKVDNIQRIARFVLSTLIRWIVIYPADSVIHLSNNRGQPSFHTETTRTTTVNAFKIHYRDQSCWYLRDSYFRDIANNLLADHDNRQLYTEINHTAGSSTTVKTISSASKSPIITRCTDHQIQLEEGDVENGRISVDELEQEHLVGEAVLVIGFCSRVFPVRQPQGQLLIDEL